MEAKEETAQAAAVAVRADTVPDDVVRVDTAMRRCAAMYHGASGRVPPDPQGDAWWRKVERLARHA